MLYMPYNRYFLRLLSLLLLFHSLPLYRKVFQSSLLLPEAFLLSTLLQYHHKCKKISVDLTDTQQFRHQTPSYAKLLKFLKLSLLHQEHLSFLLFHKASAPGPSDNFLLNPCGKMQTVSTSSFSLLFHASPRPKN